MNTTCTDAKAAVAVKISTLVAAVKMRSVVRAIAIHIEAVPLPLTVHHCYRAPFAHCNRIANKRRIFGYPPATRPMGRGAPVFYVAV